MRLLFVFAIAVAGMQGGCATIINGSTQELAVSSNPPGATVHGTPPCGRRSSRI